MNINSTLPGIHRNYTKPSAGASHNTGVAINADTNLDSYNNDAGNNANTDRTHTDKTHPDNDDVNAHFGIKVLRVEDADVSGSDSDGEDVGTERHTDRLTPVPPHSDIYSRNPDYEHIMEKYHRQKAKERQRNRMLEKEHKYLHEHKHHLPEMTQRDFYNHNTPGGQSVVDIKRGDNYMMQNYNEKQAVRRLKDLLREKRYGNKKQDTADNDMSYLDEREQYLSDRDQWWDRKYHAKKGDTYLQQKHKDFDKYWEKEEKDWNKRFHDVGDWKWKSKSHHHKGKREVNYQQESPRDPYDALPQDLYPQYDRYWNHKWYHHFHDFESSKKMTLAYHHKYHNEMVNLEDYYHTEIRNMGPVWWLKHLKRQLETEPRPISLIGNVAELIINNFPITVYTTRYEKDHEKLLSMIQKQREKAEVSEDALITIELDNTRAGLKIFSDLRHFSPMMSLPQVWCNRRLLGTYETIKNLKQANKLLPMLRENEFEGKMPCKKCQKAAKSWYKKWHRQHYPYFDKSLPYEAWS